MMEDIVLMRRHLGSATALCTLCGSPYPDRLLQPREGVRSIGNRSAFADICPECDRLLHLGDDPAVPLAVEVECSLERSA